jgi:hypothetical protein
MAKKPTIGTPQLPEELRPFVIPPKIVVTKRSGAAILKKMRTGKATKALRDLMRDGD